MRWTTDFITKLVRAANEVGQLTDCRKRRAPERAATTIRDMLEAIGIPTGRTVGGVVSDIQRMAALIGVGKA